MLKISPDILQEILSKNISELTVRIISGGCAGNKIEVLYSSPINNPARHAEFISASNTLRDPETSSGWQNHLLSDYQQETIDWITVWIPKDQIEKLDGGILAKTSKSWIFTHPDIKSRCGCATSFSYEKKDKIASLHVLKDLKKRFVNK